jgi:hypothetical protein
VFEDIMRVLQSSFVFKGIRTAVLAQVVQRMLREEFAPGQVIVQQGDQASPSDRLYYVQARAPPALRCRMATSSAERIPGSHSCALAAHMRKRCAEHGAWLSVVAGQ